MCSKKLIKKFGAGILASAMLITMVPLDFAHACVGFRPGDTNNGVVTTDTPTAASDTELKWEKALGSGWSSNPTPPTVVGNYVYTAAGTKLYRLDKATGEKLAPVDGFELDGDVGFTTNPIAYADGNLYIQISNGRVEKVNVSNPKLFTKEWTWSDASVKGQTISPIIYNNGYVYIGMWQGENRPGSYVCINAKTGKDEWIHQNPKAGYYWAGAYVETVVSGNKTEEYAYFGSDNGELMQVKTEITKSGMSAPEKRIIKLSESSPHAQIRSTIVKDGDYLYFTTKDGYLYKVSIASYLSVGNGDALNFEKASENNNNNKRVKIGTMATGTPSIVDGVVYIGSANGSQFSPTAGHKFLTINADNLEEINSVVSPGYPQAAPLVKDGANENYAYFTYNASPGGMKVFGTNNAGLLIPNSYQDLFVPDASGQQYCICPVMTDETGNLYYKNDSGKIFCLSKLNVAETTGLSNMTASTGTLSPEFSAAERNYNLTLPAGTSSFDLTLALEGGASATVDGTAYSGSVNINLGEALSKDVNVVVTKGTAKATYSIHVTKDTTDVITSLTATTNKGETLTLTPSFAPDVLTYETQWTNSVISLMGADGVLYTNPDFIESVTITLGMNSSTKPEVDVLNSNNAGLSNLAFDENGNYVFTVRFFGNSSVKVSKEGDVLAPFKCENAKDVELMITVNNTTKYRITLPRELRNKF